MTSQRSKHTGGFPATRMRRTRTDDWSRRMLAETRLDASDLILPVFIQEGKNKSTAIASMPGVKRLSPDLAVKLAKEAKKLGIPALALFPVIDAKHKDEKGSEAFNADNLACRTLRLLKKEVPGIGLIADVALDPYTSHGQDGIVKNGVVENDLTVDALCRQAVVLAKAGADIVAPSDMMDGRVGAIRTVLEKEGCTHTQILAYSAKYASALYGPFRDAVDSKRFLGKADKRSYQMDPANSDEALREIALDIDEGADMVMVKPGLAYLDIIQRAATRFDVPVLAYHVSGEYAMVHAAAKNGWIDGDAVMLEHLLSLKRAGARAILTYAALDVARILT